MAEDATAVTGSEDGPSAVTIDNRTGLPDAQVQHAVEAHFIENARLIAGGDGYTFQTYANEGGLLGRPKFRTPGNVFEEIVLARDVAERDDDIRATIGMMVNTAFAEGMENFHEDEKTQALFNGIAKNMNLDHALKEMYREYLTTGQVNTAMLFTRTSIDFTPEGVDETAAVRVAAPLLGILPAEHIRIIGNDLFGQGEMAYLAPEGPLKRWLNEFFEPSTTAARRDAMRREDPVSAALFIEERQIDNEQDYIGPYMKVYILNPRMVARMTMPKGNSCYPRPLLTANFALLEAKRLLNIMDYALLQGGSNFIVVAKQGSDNLPGQQEEIDRLGEVVRRASKTGVIVGDHRLSFEIITPKLEELLNKEKRRVIGRKLAMLLLRVPEAATDEGGSEGVKAEVEMLSRVITADRRDIKRHVERTVYDETVKRNRSNLASAPKLWFPKIMLQGTQWFTDYVLKLRDRGDIPRKWVVEAGGFDYEAGLAQRQREVDRGDDETLAPAAVPFSSPDMGPQDNNTGRPSGGSPDNGAPGARPGPGKDPAAPRRTINRNAGETVKAWYDEDWGQVIRIGVKTLELLQEYAETKEIGRITPKEKRALETDEATIIDGVLAVVPVNPGHRVTDIKAVRLSPGFSMLCGQRRGDKALITKALCFRKPEFDNLDAEEQAMKLGFPVSAWIEENDGGD